MFINYFYLKIVILFNIKNNIIFLIWTYQYGYLFKVCTFDEYEGFTLDWLTLYMKEI